MTNNAGQCTTHIATSTGVRQCGRKATHYLPGKPAVVSCTQHARSYDFPMPKAAS